MATDKYLGGTDDPVKKKDLFLDLIADVVFSVPSVNVARRHRGKSWTLGRRGSPPFHLHWFLPGPQHKHMHGNC